MNRYFSFSFADNTRYVVVDDKTNISHSIMQDGSIEHHPSPITMARALEFARSKTPWKEVTSSTVQRWLRKIKRGK